MTIQYTGSISGSVLEHSEKTLLAVWNNAFVALPNPGSSPKVGLLSSFRNEKKTFPIVVFMHGSSGINKQIKDFCYWLADSLGFATVVPDSMQTENRLTYSSPIKPEFYEVIHKMRLQELVFTMGRLKNLSFYNGTVVIAGTSEGGVAVARFKPNEKTETEKGRILFSWSCEDNYHVMSHGTNIPNNLPVLNVMSANDKFFSQANSYLNNPFALGHAGQTLKDNSCSEIILLPGAPHTLFNLPVARDAVEKFLIRILKN